MNPAFVFSIPEALARPPAGVEHESHPQAQKFFDVETAEQTCKSVLDECEATYRSTHHKAVPIRHSLGDGVGCLYAPSPYCQYAERPEMGICTTFAGEIRVFPHHDLIEEAHDAFVAGRGIEVDESQWILSFYQSFQTYALLDESITEAALRALADVDGSFAFVVYDMRSKRIWAARDRDGIQPLFWDATDDGQLVFSTDRDLLPCSASPFPAGTLYISHPGLHSHPGEAGFVFVGHPGGDLRSFVPSKKPQIKNQWRDIHAIPRLDKEGHICGAVYRVSSESYLARVAH